MHISALFILDLEGNVLLFDDCRGDFDRTCINEFVKIYFEEDDILITPVIRCNNASFIHIRHEDVILVVVTNRNVNVAIVVSFLLNIIKVFHQYFNRFEEQSVKDNFVLIYELLYEFIDFGYPQITDESHLKNTITQNAEKLENEPAKMIIGCNCALFHGPMIVYRNNDCFIDIIETVNTIVNLNKVYKNEMIGVVKVTPFLSGVPEVKIRFNERTMVNYLKSKNFKNSGFDDVQFHKCVRSTNLKQENVCFIPPDKEFELMSYKMDFYNKKPLFSVTSHFENAQHVLRVMGHFKSSVIAYFVEITIPVRPKLDTIKVKTLRGNYKYIKDKSQIVWTIQPFFANKEYTLISNTVLTEEGKFKEPVILKFEIPKYNLSGIKIRHIGIKEKSNYLTTTYFRTMTKSGVYQVHFTNEIT